MPLSVEDQKFVKAIVDGMISIATLHPCGVLISAKDIETGVTLRCSNNGDLSVNEQNRLSKKLETLSPKAMLVYNCSNPKMTSKAFSTLKSVDEVYFSFLFRMCYASQVAKIGDADKFLVLLNDNEKVRRVLRPKFGTKLAPLMKLNSKIFVEMKKLLA